MSSDVFNNIPEEIKSKFEQALRSQGFEYALKDDFVCEYGDPVLVFKLGFVMCLEAMQHEDKSDAADNKAKRKFGHWVLIKRGDEVAIEAMYGPCSGGAAYGLTEKVIRVTHKAIFTDKGGEYSRIDGKALTPPLAYGIVWWLRGERKR